MNRPQIPGRENIVRKFFQDQCDKALSPGNDDRGGDVTIIFIRQSPDGSSQRLISVDGSIGQVAIHQGSDPFRLSPVQSGAIEKHVPDPLLVYVFRPSRAELSAGSKVHQEAAQ